MDISVHNPWYRRAWFSGFFSSSHRIYDQNFGEHPPSSHLFLPLLYYRPYIWRFPNWWDSGMSEVRKERDRIVISLDVKHFSPDELTIKVNDDFIEIHGKHNERQDEHGIVAREFYRKYKIPPGVDLGSITSSLSSDGVLTICAPHYLLDILGPIIICGEKPPAQK
ncbi:crystallin, alpha B, a [Pseudorasbora parva]|uniref:crystallin, alpha B, a n=1 Tax=Pseudorasbora parva TaxID=51549 RepID=UPI00351EEBD8